MNNTYNILRAGVRSYEVDLSNMMKKSMSCDSERKNSLIMMHMYIFSMSQPLSELDTELEIVTIRNHE